jgi:hypothetical protein
MAFRNSRDWVKEQRDKLIATVNRKVMDMPIETSMLESSSYSMLSPSTNEPIVLESDISADELALDMNTGFSPHKRLKGGLGKFYSKSD